MDSTIPSAQPQLPLPLAPKRQQSYEKPYSDLNSERSKQNIKATRDVTAVSRTDFTSITGSRHDLHPWELVSISRKLLRRILGYKPFKVSYVSLYRPLRSWRSRTLLYAAVVLAMAAGAPLPIIGYIFGKIINDFPPPPDVLQKRLIELIGTACGYFALTWGWALSWGIVGEMVSNEFRQLTLTRLLGMDQAYFEVEQPDVVGMLTEKIQLIQLGTSEKVGLFLQSISYFIAAFAVCFSIDAKLAGILLSAVIPSMILTIIIGTTFTTRHSRKVTEESDSAANLAENLIHGVKTVQMTGSSRLLCQQYEELLVSKTFWSFRKAISGAVMLGCVYFIAYSANALAFYVGAKGVKDDSRAGAGSVFAVVFLILDASFVVGQFGPFIQSFAAAAAAGETMFNLLDRPTSQIDVYSRDGIEVSRKTFDGHIDFHAVTMVYPSRPAIRALDELQLRIYPGVMNGIVGPSGCGKSTLAQLLLRLYDASNGNITLGDQDIRDLNLKSLRDNIAMVGQDPILFSGTILQNIKQGLRYTENLSHQEILSACLDAAHEAGCEDFIAALPHGIHTKIGSDGFSMLSGGQKQRIALARALARDPSLLILDEYTSAMDAKSEATVLRNLRKSTKLRTTIVIAHRLATVKNCAAITVMGDGRVIEQGSHEQLLQRDGVYKSLVEAQALNNTDPDISSDSLDKVEVDNRGDSSKSSLAPSDSTTNLSEGETSRVHSRPMGIIQVLSRVSHLTSGHHIFIMIGLFAAFLSGATLLGEAVVFGHLIELLNHSPIDMGKASFYCLMFFIIALVALVSYSTSGIALGYVSENFAAKVQQESLATILRQDISWFEDTRHSLHHLISAMGSDSGRISGLSGIILGTVLSALTSVIGGIILAHAVAWKIAIVLLACVPVMLLAGFLRLKILSKAEQLRQTSYNDASALASEACLNISTVATFNLQQEFITAYKDLLKFPYRQGILFSIWGNILLAFSLSITYFVYALAYWWGSKLVRNGEYSVLQFFIVLPALLFSAQAAGMMFSLGPELTQATAAARRVFELLDSKPSIIAQEVDSKGSESYALSAEAEKDVPHVELCNVSLSYAARPGVLALNNVSLKIRAGEFVAFVGQSGGGKSSVISLLSRFYDPTSGSVLMHDVDIRSLPADQHRARIALVPQEAELFTGSVAFNVRLGASPGDIPDMDRVIDVCKRCVLHDFIMSLPEGYNTQCGNQGSSLSGGQRQRLAIARALIRDPELLLLDEITSQLDANSELEIRKAVTEASRGRTVIMVAHRLASVQHADKICVFENGTIVETGTHAELCRQGARYATMTKMQDLGIGA